MSNYTFYGLLIITLYDILNVRRISMTEIDRTEEYLNNRFGYLKELDDEDLLAVREEIKTEINNLNERLADPVLTGEAKSEIENSDIYNEEEKLAYLEEIITSRGLEKTR